MAGLTDRDLKMFDLICKYWDTGLVAQELNMTVDAIHQRFYWIRKKREQWQHDINRLNNAERKCKRLKKFLTPRKLKKKR